MKVRREKPRALSEKGERGSRGPQAAVLLENVQYVEQPKATYALCRQHAFRR